MDSEAHGQDLAEKDPFATLGKSQTKRPEMNSNDILKAALKFDGFSRVLISEHQAVSQQRALEMGIMPKVGFLRADGWSLGAPAELKQIAFHLWKNEWTHKIELPNKEWEQI